MTLLTEFFAIKAPILSQCSDYYHATFYELSKNFLLSFTVKL